MNLRSLTRGLVALGVAVLCGTCASTALARPLNPGIQISSMACPGAGDCAAVGDYLNGLGEGEGLLMSERHYRWSAGAEAALPRNASADPLNPANNTGIADVSCVATGDCTATGVYTDRTNTDRGLMLTEKHGRWQTGVELRLPRNAYRASRTGKSAADNVVLLADACRSVGNCYAVGNYITASDTIQALIVAESHGRWGTARTAPLPPNAAVRGQKAVLYAITCNAGTCTATGSYLDENGNQQAMILTESGGHWTPLAAGLPATAGANPAATPIAIDCFDSLDCAIVGNYQNGNANSLGVLLSEQNGTWAPGSQTSLPANAAAPTSYNAQTTVLIAVDCADAHDCAAVGSYTDTDGNAQALLVNENAGSWSPGQQVSLPSNANLGATQQTAALDTVSCPAVGDCIAGGEYTDTADNDDSMLVAQSDGTWGGGVEVRLPADAAGVQYSAVDSVACWTIGNCVAIGTYNDGAGDTLAYSLTEHGGTWGRGSELAPPAPTLTELKLAVTDLLTVSGRDATVNAIGRSHGFKQPYVLLAAGRMTLDWYAVQGKSRQLVASGSATSRSATDGKLQLRLTRAGRELFVHGARLKLLASAVFRSRHGRVIRASKGFTLT